MSLGGSQKSETSVPDFVTDGGEFGVNRSKALSEIGYMPYFGPDVAALSPQQYAAMQNTNNAASAFGMATAGGGGGGQAAPAGSNPQTTMGNYQTATVGDSEAEQAIQKAYLTELGRAPDAAGFEFWKQNYNPDTFQQQFTQGTQIDPMTGLPAAGNFNGIRGYSSGPQYMQALEALAQLNPGQLSSYNDMFINPQTGAAPAGMARYSPQAQQTLASMFMNDGPANGGMGNAGHGGNPGSSRGLGDVFGGIGDAVGGLGDRVGGAVSGAVAGWNG